MRKVTNRTRTHTGTTAGIFCFAAGILTPMLGGLLTAVEWIVGSALHPWLHIIATTLFVVGIPLILIAGFCLDWAERAPKKPSHAPPVQVRRTLQIKSS